MCLIFDKETDGLSAFLYLAVEPLELSIGSLFHLDGGYSLRLLHSVVFFFWEGLGCADGSISG
jgi:hypothetical protein